MAGSRIVAVRKAVTAGLVTAFAAQPNIKVTYGFEGMDEARKREQVFTNGGRGPHDPAALKTGRNFRKELLTFNIHVLITGVGMKPEESDQRVLDIGVVVEEYLADRKSNELGVTGLNWIRMSDFELLPHRPLESSGTFSEATYTVTYDARLT